MNSSESKNPFKRFLLTSLFENIYYLLKMYIWLVLGLVGAGLGIAVLLFLLEWLFPEDVHFLNYKLTDTTFRELYEGHNYHAAIFLAETDTSYVNDDLKNLSNKDMLRDCYLHVGEYTKAEKISRELLTLDYKSFENYEASEDLESFETILHAIAARDLFRLYEKMGDRPRQLEMYELLKTYSQSPDISKLEKLIDEQGLKLPVADKIHPELFSLGHSLKYDLICGLYLDYPEEAIDSLVNYLSEIWQVPCFSPSLKLSFVNRLISWNLERNNIFMAQAALLSGLDIVPTLSKENKLEPLGEFAEYCYILHDTKNARRFMRIYMHAMEKYYRDDDMEYLLAEVRYLKYQELSEEKQMEVLSHCCRGLREQISRNFAGMTANQQDYFVNQLSAPFSYSLELLDCHPDNKELIELCFENEVFNRGLLLRSDVLLRRALAEQGDQSLLGDYDNYLNLKRELVARNDIKGPGNYARKLVLEKQVSDLEKTLADGCAEFARSNYSIAKVSDFKPLLSSKECLVVYTLIPGREGMHLGAFVLSGKQGLEYTHVCTSSELVDLEGRDVLDLCVDSSSYLQMFAAVENIIPKIETLLYSPTGIMHRIPLSALYVDETHVLGDNYNFVAVADPTHLREEDSRFQLKWNDLDVMLWGGIDYGGMEQEARHRAPALRGEELGWLPHSKSEIDGIKRLLNDKVKSIISFTDSSATEQSFKSEASQAEIIHISTHGFFKEDAVHEHSSSMHNCGLFFANANRVWKHEYHLEDYLENYEDGILRADEIESQNLSACQLVVLSACETGLGDIKGNEGVYGLQRAFKLAGARCILMSLWSVPDGATEELMKRFYESLLNENDVNLAFRKAQMNMRESTNPMYGIQDWGGFVLLH